MLNRIWLLTKLEVCNIFGFNQIRHSKDKKEKSKSRGAFIAYLLIYIIFGMYAFMFATGLRAMGAPTEIPTFFVVITMVFILMTNIFKAGHMLFNLKSYERLASLPVKPIEIVISKFLYLYAFSFVTDAIFFIPAMVIAGTGLPVGPMFYVNGVLITLLMPFLPITISILFGTLIMLITSKMKHKNIFQTIFTLLFTTLALGLSFFSNQFGSTIGEAAENPDFVNMILNAAASVRKYFPISQFAFDATTNENILGMVLFALVTLVPFLVVALFVGWKYVPLCQRLNATAKAKSQRLTFNDGKEKNNLSRTLIKKEFKRLFASPMYLTNSITGFIMLLIGAIVLVVTFKFRESQGSIIPAELQGGLAKYLAVVISFFGFMTCASVSSISIEGKNWWIYKTLPITQKQIVNSKLAVNFLISIPFVIVSVLLVEIFIKFQSWDDYVILFIVPTSAVIFNGVMGLKLNMKYPKLEWANEAEVVKQSKAVTFLMLIGLGITIVMGVPTAICGLIPGLSLIGGIYAITISTGLIIVSYFIYKSLFKYDILLIE